MLGVVVLGIEQVQGDGGIGWQVLLCVQVVQCLLGVGDGVVEVYVDVGVEGFWVV